MGLLEDLHQEHKARQERIKLAAQKLKDKEVGNNKFDIVLHELCNYYKVRKGDILSHRRQQDLAKKRQIFSYLLYLTTPMTNPQIATKMDRDPTSIGYSIKKIQSELHKFQKELGELEANIKSAFSRRD